MVVWCAVAILFLSYLGCTMAALKFMYRSFPALVGPNLEAAAESEEDEEVDNRRAVLLGNAAAGYGLHPGRAEGAGGEGGGPGIRQEEDQQRRQEGEFCGGGDFGERIIQERQPERANRPQGIPRRGRFT